MPVNVEAYKKISVELKEKKITLVAVSKTKPAEDIMALYDLGQRDFGENYVQELTDKQAQLPEDIRWHFIGHLQSNKAKYIAPFVHLIHGVDSQKLLQEINKQGIKINRTINCLLQVHIAQEETKFGFDNEELEALLLSIKNNELNTSHVNIHGLMGMASFTDDKEQVIKEFRFLKSVFDNSTSLLNGTSHNIETLSMGMSADYDLAIANGSTMVRIGSLLFGERNYK